MVCIRSFCILGLASMGTASAIARDVVHENIDILARQTQESTPPAKEAYCELYTRLPKFQLELTQ